MIQNRSTTYLDNSTRNVQNASVASLPQIEMISFDTLTSCSFENVLTRAL